MQFKCRTLSGAPRDDEKREPRNSSQIRNSLFPDHDSASTKANNMNGHKDGVNPLRPYYKPPTIGEPSSGPAPTPGPKAFATGNATGKYASKARDLFHDIDYKDYISEPSPSLVQTVKDVVDELLWKYTSVLMAQPFEVAKTILQVRSQDDRAVLAAVTSPTVEQRQPSQRMSVYDEV
jgi:mitochondrial fusion and transport protein UGO1